jgi:23S rRNA (cytosine1962-C5)-methyltransferase
MILTTQPEKDYALIDSGDGKKLERYGQYLLARPDPQALWKPLLSANEWNKADAVFIRDGKKTEWKTKKQLPEKWSVNFAGLVLEIIPTTFKHTGLFPEHAATWKWMRDLIKKSNRPVSVLNLFGYTGAASLACAQAGATVCHVDGSKLAIEWAKRNQKLSGLSPDSVRWILDDVLLFLKREIKRGNRYDAIIMDPPAFGRGPDGEIWKIEEQFHDLLDSCRKVLSDKPLFLVINGYASGFSSIAYQNNILPFQKEFGGILEHGELTITEEGSGRLLPCGIFARWSTLA